MRNAGIISAAASIPAAILRRFFDQLGKKQAIPPLHFRYKYTAVKIIHRIGRRTQINIIMIGCSCLLLFYILYRPFGDYCIIIGAAVGSVNSAMVQLFSAGNAT